MWREGNTFTLLVGMQTGAATVEASMQMPEKIKTDLPFDLAIPLLGIYPKEPKTLIRKNISTHIFITAYLQLPSYGSSPSVHQ